MRFSKLVLAALFVLGTSAAHAQLISFEGVAPPGSVRNVSPTMPYTEAGYTFLPLNGSSAVFSSTIGFFPGDNTDFFGFAGGNTITLTGPGNAPFALTSLLVGQLSFSTAPSTDVTFTGFLAGGGTQVVTFTGLTGATLETLNFTNVSSVTIVSSTDSGIDDVNVNPAAVPEPGSLALLAGMGLSGAGFLARRRKNARKAL